MWKSNLGRIDSQTLVQAFGLFWQSDHLPVRRSLKQPIIDGRSLATSVLPGNLYGRCFSRSRLWNRSVFRVSVQLGIHGSGVRSTSELSFRERSSLRKSSRLQMVTLRQPATTPSLRGHSFELPIAHALQSEVMWLTTHQSCRSSGRDPKLLALASTWPTLASTEALLLTVELPQAVRPDRYSYRSIIQANAEVAAPESRGQR